MLGGLGVCAGYAFAVWVKGQEPPKGKDPSIKHASLGVIRLDWHYHPLAGDVGSTDSFEYPVFYRAVPGLTFEVCQSGVMTPEIKEHFKEAIRYLDQDKQVSVITSDCGFFMWFQKEARQYTAKPVVMSSLALLPAIHAALGTDGKIAIFSANSESLQPMHDTVAREMGVDWNADCYVLVGCQDVEGFEAVATGEPVDLGKVTPGIVKKAVEVTKTKNIHAILMECTQLPFRMTSAQRQVYQSMTPLFVQTFLFEVSWTTRVLGSTAGTSAGMGSKKLTSLATWKRRRSWFTTVQPIDIH